jgi:Flp pilus assembly protein TadD
VPETFSLIATYEARAVRLRQFFAQDPENQSLACDLADACFEAGDVIAAQRALESIDQKLREPSVRFRIARCLLATGAYAHAETEYASLQAEGHDSAAVRHDLAFTLLCQHSTDKAMRTISSAIANFGPTPELLILKSRTEAVSGDFAQAAASADAALALRPDDAMALGVKALALLDGNELHRAGQVAREALALDSDQHEALLTASTLSLWGQDLDAAQVMFERALVRHHNSGRALSGYGQLLMLRNDLPRANEVLERAVQAMPNHIGTWHALAWCQLLRSDRDGAENSYRKAYEVDRNFGDTHGGLALVAALRGDYEAAEKSAKRAIRLDPDAITARYAQALVLEARGDTEGSEAAIAGILRGNGSLSALPVKEFARRLKSTLSA